MRTKFLMKTTNVYDNVLSGFYISMILLTFPTIFYDGIYIRPLYSQRYYKSLYISKHTLSIKTALTKYVHDLYHVCARMLQLYASTKYFICYKNTWQQIQNTIIPTSKYAMKATNKGWPMIKQTGFPSKTSFMLVFLFKKHTIWWIWL